MSEYPEYDNYIRGVWIVAVPVFLAGWGHAIAHDGFFLGAGLGWISAGFLAGYRRISLAAFRVPYRYCDPWVRGDHFFWRTTHP